MAQSEQLVAEKREGRGSRRVRRMRSGGRLPAVIYGHKQETLSVSLSLEDFARAVRRGVRVLDLKTDGGVEKALIRDLQWDHLGKEILHADFERVSADERIQIPVKITLRGIAPGVTAGGVLDQPVHMIQIECLAIAIPDSIRVNINELQIEDAIHIRDLVLPEGVKALGDPDAIVVHVTAPVAEVEPTAAPAPVAAGAAEPEVIGRVKGEEAEAEEQRVAKVVVGLGNPGRQYHGTRHNVGFAVVDLLADSPRATGFQTKFQAEVAELMEGAEKLLLVKPQTFMNLSGRCVRQIVDFYQLPVEDLLILCDDINLPLGKLRVRAKGTHGGHNGLRDIQNHLGTTEYSRLRIGVDAPQHDDAIDHVLGKFRASEREVIEDAVRSAAQAVIVWATRGIAACMNEFNVGSDKT